MTTKQTEYRVMAINAPVFDNQPTVFAKDTSEAVRKTFGKSAVRSGGFHVDYRVTNLSNGRHTYLKEIK